MRHQVLRFGVLGFLGGVLLVAAGTAALAQPVYSSLEELKALVPAASTVKVTDSMGHERKGKLTSVTADALTLRTGDVLLTLEAGDVRRVRVRKEDSVLNGALYGAAIGGGLSSLIFLDNECWGDSDCVAYVAINTAFGAFIGMGVDALIHGYRVAYMAQAPAGPSVTVAPFVSPEARGVQVRVAF